MRESHRNETRTKIKNRNCTVQCAQAETAGGLEEEEEEELWESSGVGPSTAAVILQ